MEITVKPDYTGVDGNAAWELDRKLFTEGTAVTVAWVLQLPTAHPIFKQYLVSCISLADITGIPKAIVHLPGATHEIAVYAMNPDDENPTLQKLPSILQPPNFVGQFIAANDAEAYSRTNATVFEVMVGVLLIDTDYRHMWVNRFGGHCLKK